MTCIVAIASGGKVYMGGDSAAVDDCALTYVKHSKVIINGDYLIGYTSSFRMGQLLQFADLPKMQSDCDAYEFMIKIFVESVRILLKSGGYATVNNNNEASGFFLVGFKGRLFQISSDMAVLEYLDGFDATGSGERVALGSLYSSTNLSPKDRVLNALEAAAHFTTSVRGPFYIYEN